MHAGQSAAPLAVRWPFTGAVHLAMWPMILGIIAALKRYRKTTSPARLWPRPDLRSGRPSRLDGVQCRVQGEGRGDASSTVWCIGLTVGGLLSRATTRDSTNDRKLRIATVEASRSERPLSAPLSFRASFKQP